jgi:hypothetical protein
LIPKEDPRDRLRSVAMASESKTYLVTAIEALDGSKKVDSSPTSRRRVAISVIIKIIIITNESDLLLFLALSLRATPFEGYN